MEINSSFYRPHRRSTYERWAASVPAAFRFAVKVPRAVTHDRRLREAGGALDAFLAEAAGLGERRLQCGGPGGGVDLGAVGVRRPALADQAAALGVPHHDLARLGRRVDPGHQRHD